MVIQYNFIISYQKIPFVKAEFDFKMFKISFQSNQSTNNILQQSSLLVASVVIDSYEKKTIIGIVIS